MKTTLTPHQKAWATRRKAATSKAKSIAAAKAWATRKAAKSKSKTSAKAKNQAKNKAKKKKPAVLNAAQKAWITRRAKTVATTVIKKLPVVSKAPKYNVVAQVKQVKGVIAGTVTQPELTQLIATAKVQPVVAKKATTPTRAVPTVATVKELLNTEAHWTKRYSATDKSGNCVAIESDKAEKFCLSGAIHRVYSTDGTKRAEAFKKVENVIKGYSLGTTSGIAAFNDRVETTFKDIQRVVAIAGV